MSLRGCFAAVAISGHTFAASVPLYVPIINYFKPGYRIVYLAEHNELLSQRRLAQFYQAGRYPFKHRLDKAFYWYQRAARRGDALSQYQLGQLYWLGQGVQQDKQRGLDWLYQAAEQGDRLAQQNWVKYIIQLSQEWDRLYPQRQAYDRFRLIIAKACHNDPVASYKLGLLTEYGGLYTLALRWYRRSATSYYPAALLRLGFLYDNGIGVIKNRWLAAYYYREYHNVRK